MKQRLDVLLTAQGLATSRSQAESWIKMGKVLVDGRAVEKPGVFISTSARLELKAEEKYVSRAGLKLSSVARELQLDFNDQVVLDVGSSTGGFTDFALKHGAQKVIAVDVGTNQLHPSLRGNPKVELHEQTDIRDVVLQVATPGQVAIAAPDIVVIDVSFISLRDILPHIATLCRPNTRVVAMFKPQFETGSKQKHKGVIKNDTMRRDILHDFENWVKKLFIIRNKADSEVAGSKGNRERFYMLQLTRSSR